MKLATFSPVFFLLSAGLTSLGWAAPPRPGVPTRAQARALYGQGFDFWTKVKTVTQGTHSTGDLVALLDSSFDHPEEGIASFGLGYETPIDGTWFGSFMDRAGVGIGLDGIAGGSVHNRILPEIDAYQAFAGHVDLGVRHAPKMPDAGWELGAGSSVGLGQMDRVRGSAVELIDGGIPNRSSLFYSGLELLAGYRDRLSAGLRTVYQIRFEPTYFHQDFTASSAQYAIRTEHLVLRWRQESEWTLRLDTPFVPDFELGAIAITGQQPTPIPLLPRIWDSVHDLNVFPAAGQLVGLGARAAILDPRGRLGLTVDGGFYGGYLGASARLSLWALHLMAGTYGLEHSAGYRLDGSRLDFISIGGAIAL